MDFSIEVEKILKSVGVNGEINLSIPPKASMGDFSFPCFNLSKIQKKSPIEISKELVEKIKKKKIEIIDKVEVVGPYVNFFLNSGIIAKKVIKTISKERKKYGIKKVVNSKKVLIEYPSNNTHKELHVGHLRNICLGNALSGIYKSQGYKVLPINYINDFGAHVARCLWWIKKQNNIKDVKTNKQKWLGEQYIEASNYLQDHKEEKEDVAKLQLLLEKKDKNIWTLFLKTRKWSLDGFQKIFKELGLKHKASFFEKDIKIKGQKIVDKLLKKGLAKIGERGAVIIDLNDYKLDVALLRKSDGSGLYMTSDLALAVEKNKKFKPKESIHITGLEQDFYFKQLFKILKLSGFKYKMLHIGYGLVNLSTGKMSSRKGNVFLYEDLREMVRKALLEKAPHLEKDKKRLEKIMFASIKFDFLKHESNKSIIFDPSIACSFDGFTGPYILYVIARVNGLNKKNGNKSANLKYLELLEEIEEKQIVLTLSRYEEKLEFAYLTKNPSVMIRYVFDLAKEFNNFYNKHSILNAENKELKEARLALSYAVSEVLTNAMNILGIEVVKEM